MTTVASVTRPAISERAQRHRPVQRIGRTTVGEIGEGETRAEQRSVIAAKGEEGDQAEGKQDQEKCDQRARREHRGAKEER